MKKGGGGDPEHLKEGDGTEVIVSLINNYLCGFSMATASTCDSVTISSFVNLTDVCTYLSRENNRNKSQAILGLLN